LSTGPARGESPAFDGWRNGLAYGLLGFGLAFAALPLYVILPNHYAREFGVPLASLGAVLLGARLFDALIDPALGRLNDRLFARSPQAVLNWSALAVLALALGVVLLFFPLMLFPQLAASGSLLWWAGFMLVLTYAGYSSLSIAHQSWGAMLGGSEAQRSRIVGWREGLGLLGVVSASVLPAVLGLGWSTSVFVLALVFGWLAWRRSVEPVRPLRELASAPSPSVWLPLRQPAFRRLLAVFMLNGIASAVPATLVLFFVQDRLAAPASMEPLFLGSYFLCAALSIPVWLALVRRLGLARSWLAGMLMAVLVFVWASQLGTGQVLAFALVCAASGLALGADLALPGALLAGLIHTSGHAGRAEGAYFGWWNFATKLNLALAAGLALPLLDYFGYAPGVRSEQALGALVVAYCVLPCLLKLAAATGLYVWLIRQPAPAVFSKELS
jgi:GPH family glycoside/pentoside/hexuronide:cation symporter